MYFSTSNYLKILRAKSCLFSLSPLRYGDILNTSSTVLGAQGLDTQLPQYKTHDYPTLTLNGEDEFRLVAILPRRDEEDICCRLLNTKLQNAPKYEVSSYTWKP